MKNQLFLFLAAMLLVFSCGEDDDPSLIQLPELGLVAHYSLNGNANNEVDNTAGVLHGGITFGADREGNTGLAILLDGEDDYVEIPHDPAINFAPNQGFAISVWIKADEQVFVNNKDNDILSKWCNLSGDCDSYPFTLRFYNRTSTDPQLLPSTVYGARYTGGGTCGDGVAARSDVVILDNSFHHIVFQKNTTVLELWIDGSLHSSIGDSSADNADCSTQNTSPLLIGVRLPDSTNANWFKGSLDELRIYNRALTKAEIENLANS